MTLLNAHFTYLKVEYVNIINNITYGNIRMALKRFDSIPLDGFLTTEQFNAAFAVVIEFLEHESLVVLAQVHELIHQATLVAFKRKLKMFRDAALLAEDLSLFIEGLKVNCFAVIEDAVMTIIREVYFNDSFEVTK
jgi:hypothetical protein